MKTMPPSFIANAFVGYRHFDDFYKFIETLQTYVGGLQNLRVLEAGCGSGSYFDLSACEITGIDISPEQLERNTTLSTRICADLHTYEDEAWLNSFDLIVCWNVIEHLERPGIALDKFMRWLKPDGRIVLAFPNPQTLKGRVTKYTPLFVHKLFYRMYLGTPLTSGGDGRGPFPTIFAREIELKRLLSQLHDGGFRVELLQSFEANQNHFIKKYLSESLVDWSSGVFLGDLRNHVDRAATDFALVISKRSPESPLIEVSLPVL